MSKSNIETNVGLLHNVPLFRVDIDNLTVDKIMELIDLHETKYIKRYKLLHDYYLGKHSIRDRSMDGDKPNNRLIDNFAEYITSIKNGYFLGRPIAYKSNNEAILKAVQDVFDDNDEQDINNENGRLASIFGHCFELNYINDEAEHRFVPLSPVDVFGLYSNEVGEELVGGVRYLISQDQEGNDVYNITLYKETETIAYSGKKDEVTQVESKSNIFGSLPLIEFKNNNERLSDFENVITLIDAYEVIQSDSTNEVQYFNDAYLVLKNLEATDDSDIDDMKNNRVIKLDGDGEAEWLVKNINDTHIQNQLKNIKNDIHKFSKTPDLNDEAFATNLSGVAIKYKMWTLEQDVANKERKFKKGIKDRIKLVLRYFKITDNKDYDHKEVGIEFTRNIPMNDLENAQMVTLLQGLVSDDTRRALLSMISNPKDENEAVAKQLESQADQLGFNKDVNPTQQQNQEQEILNK